jgi:hypothetical protein
LDVINPINGNVSVLPTDGQYCSEIGDQKSQNKPFWDSNLDFQWHGNGVSNNQFRIKKNSE